VELKAGDLREELAPKEDRIDGKKTIFLEMEPGKRPLVAFTGFWSGKYISAAMNSVAKAYRTQRARRITRPSVDTGDKPTPQTAVGKGG
jgi:hypothetical protein